MASLVWWCIIVASCLARSSPVRTAVPSCATDPNEATALRALFQGWNQTLEIGERLPGWNLTGSDPCTGRWAGVICETNASDCKSSVLGLQLLDLNLVGDLSPAIGNLANLRILNIAGNPGITGSLPASIGNLTLLIILDLHDNRFSGLLPASLQNLTALQTLDFSGNNFTGEIPRWLGALKQLYRLDLSSNQLSGSLPTSTSNGILGLNNLTYAVEMSFSDNVLSGPLPDLDGLYVLQNLNLSNNHLNSTLSHSLGNLRQLTILDLSSNNFSGLFANMSNFVFLQEIYMADNNISGQFPPDLLNLSSLRTVNFDGNQFNGSLSLPLINSNTSRLQSISLVNNSITSVTFANSSLLSTSQLLSSDLLFLGGNPTCADPQTDVLLQVCRFNSKSVIMRVVRDTNRKLIIIICSIVAVVVVLASTVSFIVIRRLLKKIIALHEIQREFAKNDVQPNLYSYNELRTATQDFHPDNRLGQGGFGIVYKGVLFDGTELAVKQLNKSEQGLTEFLNEIVVITGVRHKNLVKLKGCCISGDQRILVYEYVENKNLAEALWDSPSKGSIEIDWSKRFNIILGIARGLTYLHEEVQPPIIHRDIKAPNILLDKDLNPKIGDFGLALLYPILDGDHTHLSGFNVAGTKGYLSPEYASFGQVSEKIDVFSFGILVLEIVSGRKNIDFLLPIEQRYILEWAWKLHENGPLTRLIDPKLNSKVIEEDINRVINIGLLCVQYTPSRRPTMSKVISMLLGNNTLDSVFRGNELSKVDIDTMFASIQSTSLTPVDEDSPLLMGLPTTSATGAFIELGKLKPR